eukprot:4768913-Amphidinium_carterae.1
MVRTSSVIQHHNNTTFKIDKGKTDPMKFESEVEVNHASEMRQECQKLGDVPNSGVERGGIYEFVQ